MAEEDLKEYRREKEGASPSIPEKL